MCNQVSFELFDFRGSHKTHSSKAVPLSPIHAIDALSFHPHIIFVEKTLNITFSYNKQTLSSDRKKKILFFPSFLEIRLHFCGSRVSGITLNERSRVLIVAYNFLNSSWRQNWNTITELYLLDFYCHVLFKCLLRSLGNNVKRILKVLKSRDTVYYLHSI